MPARSIHTIGSNKSGINLDPWLNKYIFPNGMFPLIKQIAHAYQYAKKLSER